MELNQVIYIRHQSVHARETTAPPARAREAAQRTGRRPSLATWASSGWSTPFRSGWPARIPPPPPAVHACCRHRACTCVMPRQGLWLETWEDVIAASVTVTHHGHGSVPPSLDFLISVHNLKEKLKPCWERGIEATYDNPRRLPADA